MGLTWSLHWETVMMALVGWNKRALNRPFPCLLHTSCSSSYSSSSCSSGSGGPTAHSHSQAGSEDTGLCHTEGTVCTLVRRAPLPNDARQRVSRHLLGSHTTAAGCTVALRCSTALGCTAAPVPGHHPGTGGERKRNASQFWFLIVSH